MKTLFLHVDYIKFKPLKKALKNVEPLSEKEKKGSTIKDALAILTAVEKSDVDVDKIVKKLVENIKEIAESVKVKNIVLYPYAHLSSDLASPNKAIEILKKAEEMLKKEKGFSIFKAPFGYYKEFEVKVKGHPLAELSREIKVEEKGKEGTSEKDFDYKNALRSIGKSVLDRKKLKPYDHRIIGQEMDLFSFNEVSPGSVFWHSNGLIIYNELINFWREVHKKMEYQEISTPQILDNRLWKISGHWNLYKEHMFLTEYENRDFAVKPMNCPGAMLVYKNKTRSYKELPLRFSEMGVVHRKELSGVLAGLVRVVKMTQDDAHIFCTEKQLENEIVQVVSLFREILDKFGFKYRFTISVRSKKKEAKYLGNDKIWKKAEDSLIKGLKKLKLKFDIEPGEAKFYGPSLDIQIKDSLGREWQCSTLQLDFNLPERFNLEYTGDDNKNHTPLLLHRVVYGSLERFIGILIEHCKGRFPLWLSPIQVRVLSFTERNVTHAKKVIKQLAEKIPNLRIDVDFRNVTMQGKVKDAELMRIPYIIVIGDKEESSNSLAVRIKGSKKIESLKIGNFTEDLKKEIAERK